MNRINRSAVREWVILFVALVAGGVLAADKPNIVWMVSEDNGARWLGCYGNPAKPTPNLDKLASEGFRYTNAYASVPVCAPQRFTWITGMNAISVGTQGMRGGVAIPNFIQFYPEIFQKLGYYVSKGNDSKEDYNFRGRIAGDTWNERKKIDWDVLKTKEPFLHVFNTHDSHEWNSFGSFKLGRDKAPPAKNLASYHPDIPEMRYVYEKYTEAHRKMDGTVAGWLQELEDSGMAENTIVVYSSDHGGVLPRSKRYLYNSGTHCPLIVRIPKKYKHLYPAAKPGDTVDELVSFVDFPKTLLGLGGASAVDVKQMQGRFFLGDKKEPEPQYVYSFRNRMDDRRDMVRSSRDRKLLYIRNYMPFAPVGQYQPYCYNSASTRAWRAHHLAGKTNEITGRFFQQPRNVDELYDYQSDYDNVKNLAGEGGRAEDVQRMRAALRAWQLSIFDTGFLPEADIDREAKKHELTVYEFARKPELYPLESYMDMADKSLEMDAANLPEFLKALTSKHLGLRYWATLGIVNLSFADKLSDSGMVASSMSAMVSNEESEVIQAYAAWLLIRHGEEKRGIAAIQRLAKKTYDFRTIVNVVDWMQAKHAVPLAREIYLAGNFQNGDQVKIMAAVLNERGSRELASLIERREKNRQTIKAREGRLKKLAKMAKEASPEKADTERKKTEQELAKAQEEGNKLDAQIAAVPLSASRP